jgi:hypothetical protein
MTFRYQIKKGYEDRHFVGARRIDDSTIESNEPLESPLLELIEDNSQPQAQAQAPAAKQSIPPIPQVNPQQAKQPDHPNQPQQETK